MRSDVTLGGVEIYREQVSLRAEHLGDLPSESTTPLWLGGSAIIYGALVMWTSILATWPT
jgi:hypothetical protein